MLAHRHHASHVATMGSVAQQSDGGEAVEVAPGVVACVVPSVPQRSLFNCVMYEQGDALLGALGDLAELYAGAGVQAWTVWVPPHDDAVDAGLDAAGHALDATPELMCAPLEEIALDAQDPDGVRIGPAAAEACAPVVDLAFETVGQFAGVLSRLGEPVRWWAATDGGGRLLSCVATVEHQGDVYVTFVSTLHEARGRGLAAAVLRHALREGAARGCTTTSLEATAMGRPVYRRMGYRELGALRMRERRAA